MQEYTVWGGHSYTVGVEQFGSLVQAATEYMHRMSPLAIGFPVWGDCDDDDVVLATDTDGWTLRQVRVIANTTFGYYG